jgi:hypothetical protein
MQFSSWLDERFVHDVKARNQEVEAACFAYFDKLDVIHIMDVGSGTGSTFLALYHKIAMDQNWTFLEQDSSLIEHSIQRICKELEQEGYAINKADAKIIFTKGSKTIALKTINDSLLNIEQYISDGSINLVTASAIFDLFSIDQYIKFDRIVRQDGCSILSVLNYTGMAFDPIQEGDDTCIDLYHGHMLRSQHFGIGMGPNCHRDIQQYYSDINANYCEGKSIWHLEPEAKAMHSFILEYMETAISEMPGRPDYFEDWLSAKRRSSNQTALAIRVDHFDYFVTP